MSDKPELETQTGNGEGPSVEPSMISLPGFWRNETSGVLAPAIERYLNHRTQLRDIPVYPRVPLPVDQFAGYHWRLALYDRYCGQIRRGECRQSLIPGSVLLQGWQNFRAELQRELSDPQAVKGSSQSQLSTLTPSTDNSDLP